MSLGTKFQLQLTILIFLEQTSTYTDDFDILDQTCPWGYFHLKTEKENIATEFRLRLGTKLD